MDEYHGTYEEQHEKVYYSGLQYQKFKKIVLDIGDLLSNWIADL